MPFEEIVIYIECYNLHKYYLRLLLSEMLNVISNLPGGTNQTILTHKVRC